MATRKIPSDIFKAKAIGEFKPIFSKSKLGLKLVTEFPGNPFPDGRTRVSVGSVAVFSHFPAAPVNPDLTIYFTWFNEDVDGLAIGSSGSLTRSFLSDSVSRLGVGSYSLIKSVVFVSDNAISRIQIRSRGDIYAELCKANWVKWSDIGSLNFTISKSNVAGERPLDWKGFVYHLKKLKSKVVAYGQGGVSFLIPVDNVYSLQTIYRVGVKNKGAVAGNEDIHFFVDSLNQLWKLDQDLERLDYSEYISNMTDSIILSYDIENRLLYICDGIVGYVYGVDTKSLGLGPANITGIGSLYIVSSDNIEIPLFEICTDIYDFGTRKSKTIQSVEVGSNLTNHLYVSVDYRTNHQSDFKQISWFLVNPDGKAYPKCYGVEFRFRIKSLIYEQFKLDYIRVKGYINDLRDKTI